MEKNRKEIVDELKEYFHSEGIIPTRDFNCKNKNECNNKYVIECPGKELTHGMQCHVGSKYGENKIKTLVVGLDCGNGGAQNIDDRTKAVEKGDNNPHMQGTTMCISNLLFGNEENTDKECLKYYAMTNACKCCRSDSPSQLKPFFYEQCVSYKIKEIEIINPNVIYFQGKNSLTGLQFSNVDDQTTDIFEFIKYVTINDKRTYAVKCIHPSAGHGNLARRILFYKEMIPKINDYLREKLA